MWAPSASRNLLGLTRCLLLLSLGYSELAWCLEFKTQPSASTDVQEGFPVYLACEVDPPSPSSQLTFEWLLDGNVLEDQARRYVVQDGDGNSVPPGYLHITAVDHLLDEGAFECRVTDKSGQAANPQTITSTQARLNIRWIASGGKVLLKAPETEAELVVGANISLKCKIDGNPEPSYSWFRGPNRLESSSSHLQLKNSALKIFGALMEMDTGVYSCQAQNRAGTTKSDTSYNLVIKDPNSPKVRIGPSDLIVRLDDRVWMDCVIDGDPQPLINWYAEDPLTQQFEETPISNKTNKRWIFENGTMYISKVRLNHQNRYSCLGTNPVGAASAQATLQVATIEDLPVLGVVRVAQGKLGTVNCSYPDGDGGLPPPEMVWLGPDGRPLPAGVGGQSPRQEGHLLVVDQMRSDYEGAYTCQATNMAGQRNSSATLLMAVAPESVEVLPEVMVDEGAAMNLPCRVTGTTDYTVTWLNAKDNDVTLMHHGRFIVESDHTLSLAYANPQDSGTYTCLASNIAGAARATTTFTVKEKLKFSPQPVSRLLELDQASQVHCIAKGYDPPKIQWAKLNTGGRAWPPAHLNVTGGLMAFSPVLQSDAGNYTCQASSAQGTIQATIQLTVVVRPKFIIQPTDTTVYEGAPAWIHCQAQGDPTPVISWRRSGDGSSQLPQSFTPLSNGTLLISRVGPGDGGTYTCIAGNHAGLNSVDITLTVDGGGRPSEQPGMLKTIGIAVGCAAAYIILVIGLMVYCRRRRAKQLRQALAMEALKDGDADPLSKPALNGLSHNVYHDDPTNPAGTKEYKDYPENNGGVMAMTPLTPNGKQRNYDKMQFPRHDLHDTILLGRGLFGDVFIAKAKGILDGESETLVVVKALMTKDEELAIEYRQEMEVLSKLNHDHVTQLLGVCREADPQYIICQYPEWGDLKQFLRATRGENGLTAPPPLQLSQKLAVVNQVALGLEHLSNHRFIHRDVAARNILLSPSLDVKLAFMGLCQDMYRSEYVEYNQRLQPVRWMPAEALFEGEFSTKSDVWSFAVLLWEVFQQGETPYPELGDPAVLEELQAATLELSTPPDCPDELEILFTRCLSATPKDRPTFSDIAITLGEIQADSNM